MTYDEALSWWFGRVDFEKRSADPTDLKLDRMRALLRGIGDPHERLRIVHVAGSKGKGSTAAMIASIGQAAGYRVGLFTSPHLVDVRERIQVNGQPIGPADLVQRVTELLPVATAMESAGQAPTFFELATALGIAQFATCNVDLAVLEVGLGGRFDATNVCEPAVSVITSISYDHLAILGHKLSQIAFEKSGIIKPGIPVVNGVTAKEAAEVVRRRADECSSPLFEIGTDFRLDYRPGQVSPEGSITRSHCTVHRKGSNSRSFELGLLGGHQASNAALAVVVFDLLNRRGLSVSESAMNAGLANVHWPARMEVFPGRPLIVLDCAHNVASANAVIETLDESFPAGPRTLVFASSADKDVQGILTTLAPHFSVIIVTKFISNPRAVAPERLKAIVGGRALIAHHPAEAMRQARSLQPMRDLIVVTGSVYLAGEVRQLLVPPSQ